MNKSIKKEVYSFIMKEIKNPFWRTAAEYGTITISIWIMVIGIYFFKFPNHFAFGGITGFSTVISEMTQWSASDFTFITNMALLVLGFIFLGRSFGLKTVYATVVMSVSLSLLERICPLTKPLTSEPLLELMFAIFLPAIGTAILFNIGASSGGTDIIAMILKKYSSVDIGHALLITDVLITVAGCFMFDIATGLYSFLGLAIRSFMIDTFIESFNLSKYFNVVCDNPKPICDFIVQELNRSATVCHAQGAFSGKDKYVIFTALNRPQAVRLRNFIKDEEPSAFILISNTSEIIGKGFHNV